MRGKCVLTLGFFDGVHIGHQALLKRLRELSSKLGMPSLVLTFDARPVFRSQLLLTSLEERVRLIKEAGIDEIMVQPFTEEFAALSPEAFLKEVVCERFNAKLVLAGYDCRFGKDRAGDIAVLKTLAPKLGFLCEEEPPFLLDGQIVSSTLCRELLKEGKLMELEKALGRPWSLYGEIRPGRGLGHKLGYPTANMGLNGLLTPPKGVYSAEYELGKRRGKALLYLGSRPTFEEGGESLAETYLLDFSEDVYGETLKVAPKRFLGPEKRYESAEELKEAIASFVEQAKF
ncbi:riboflavin biosynthesis protein RibF [bacterium]|nr:riboflavin biosynthesis protein RibF [bacterium]